MSESAQTDDETVSESSAIEQYCGNVYEPCGCGGFWKTLLRPHCLACCEPVTRHRAWFWACLREPWTRVDWYLEERDGKGLRPLVCRLVGHRWITTISDTQRCRRCLVYQDVTPAT